MHNKILAGIYKVELEKSLYNYANRGDSCYAPDLKTNAQKLKRAINWATKNTAQKYMLKMGIGYDYIKPDIVTDQYRADHHGVNIGDSVGIIARKSKDHDSKYAKVLLLVRKYARGLL